MSSENSSERLFLTYRTALIASAAPIVGCRSRAEDVVQEAFVKFTEFVNRNDVRHPVALLFRTVRNLAVDRWRRLTLEVRTGADQEILSIASSTSASPEDAVLRRDELRLITDALQELPEHCRIAFEMHRLGGYTYEEIAETLGVSPSMVDKHIRRALTHCRARLRQTAQ